MKISAARPIISIYDPISGKPTGQRKIPDVFLSPVRTDLIHFVHTNISKNHRQPYGVLTQHGPSGRAAGHQVSAKSWGTGRAVSRIPRVAGSGTHRSGQGAIGNMCRGGHMFAPTKTWRRWHRHVNKRARRQATASALAASALPSLVSARGHSTDKILELPLVVGDGAESLTRTRQAVDLLKALGAFEDVLRVGKVKGLRAGRGKMRGRRRKKRKGPLIIYREDKGLVRAFRNIPGVDVCSVGRLNLLQLAPGSHCGRLIVWTKSAFDALDEIFGTFTTPSKIKSNFILPRYNILANTDISRIINSDEVQNALRPKKESNGKRKITKINPFVKENEENLLKLNPFSINDENIVKLQN